MHSENTIVQLNNSFIRKVDELLERLRFDASTYKHSLKVAEYSKRFIKLLNTDIDVATVYYSGLFHDIGKIGIDLNILNNKGTLRSDEFNVVMRHPQLGYNILKKAFVQKQMLYAAYYHHERWDGKGYPMRLKGDDIPVIARVISVCDVFEALTSDRPYRKAYSLYDALDIMKDSKGQFDQELFEVFINNCDSIIDA